MSALDWGVLVVYLTWLVWDGLRRSTNTDKVEGYFLASRSLPWWAVGLSVMATQMSAITIVGTTGQAYATGLRFVDALSGAAQRGVAVRVLIDGFGARDMPRALRDRLRDAGVRLLVFRPDISPIGLKRQRLRRMHRKLAVVDARIAFIGGIIFWGGFNTAMEWTNREAFCISCHEMKVNVFAEYRNTIHYQNRTGVRATCPDCHVPKEWIPKIIRKVQASNELLHKALGSIDTPEKFNAKRAELAGHEWARMKNNNSQECRNCHNWDAMSSELQKQTPYKKHMRAREAGKTCIDCHKGIAHGLPAIEQHIGAPKPGSAEAPSGPPAVKSGPRGL